ncbi:MAG: hypothetical protein E5V74_13275 [Mesorhizobium sp.]|nr:MAG: hypothetical protein E5W03_08165 [Mesorhizobium sp.]TIV17634.1 MAG: hypothetical protein E5W02_13280 [Mesorhizobium sp.]TIV58736.1 MAG: hypothetical protein E5V86_24680 [Mesorhizobium sp.]TIW01838.1 MAG: hypothetical protein E5V74_13275 [Mesorhizobium sp.]
MALETREKSPMDSTGWMHLGVLLLVFVGVAAFVRWKMVLPAPKQPPRGETVAGARRFIGLWFGGGGR